MAQSLEAGYTEAWKRYSIEHCGKRGGIHISGNKLSNQGIHKGTQKVIASAHHI